MSDADLTRSVAEAETEQGDSFKATPVKNQQAFTSSSDSTFLVTKVRQHSFESKPSPPSFSSLVEPCEDDTTVKNCHSPPKKQKSSRYKVKSGVPMPPRPVLSLSQEEIREYFPTLVEKLSGRKFPPQVSCHSYHTSCHSVSCHSCHTSCHSVSSAGHPQEVRGVGR